MKEDVTTTNTTAALWWCRQWLSGGLVAESMADGKGCRDDKRAEERHREDCECVCFEAEDDFSDLFTQLFYPSSGTVFIVAVARG